MRLIATLLAVSLLSSCSLLKIPGRTLKSVARTFGLSANDASIQIGGDPSQVTPEISPK